MNLTPVPENHANAAVICLRSGEKQPGFFRSDTTQNRVRIEVQFVRDPVIPPEELPADAFVLCGVASRGA